MSKHSRDEVIEILRASGPLTLKELYEKTELSITAAALGFDLNKLKNEGIVVLQEGRRWALVDGSSPPPAQSPVEQQPKKTEATIAVPTPAEKSTARQPEKTASALKQPAETDITQEQEIKAQQEERREKARAHFKELLGDGPFRIALASDHSLIIQDGAKHMQLSPDKTRIVIEYLDQMLIDRQRRPWYARLRGMFGGVQ